MFWGIKIFPSKRKLLNIKAILGKGLLLQKDL